jgi:hypothetical protein
MENALKMEIFFNCAACHITAENGIYDDDDVKIPE